MRGSCWRRTTIVTCRPQPKGQRIVPAEPGGLDNFYLIERRSAMARGIMPGGYSRHCHNWPMARRRAFPRIYDLALE